MSMRERIRRAISEPALVPRAVARRLLPDHPRYGNSYIRRPDGSITFHARGFVEAASPAVLLARHNYETLRIRSLLAEEHVSRSLEVGCGYGRLTPVFAEFSNEHHAVDINEDALAAARDAYPEYTFETASATDLPFPDNHFDLVTTWTVLQHVPPVQIEKATAELLRVLRDDGMLLTCEETRYAGVAAPPRAHTWHRTVEAYTQLFAPLELGHSQELEEIDRLPGIQSPGRVMVWRRYH